jgi:SAM-dependent methyltransferase
MVDEERAAVERRKWDAHAHAVGSRGPLTRLAPDVTFESYTRGRLLFRGMVDFLGPLAGRRLLEYGCGTGELTVILARSGAKVTAFDLSEASIAVARERAALNDVSADIEFVVAPGENLPFPDESFDLAIGKAVLHHLDPDKGALELHRLLAPGGRATFSEPLGMNPVLNFVRDHVPYPNKHERGADIPLRRQDIVAWGRPFRSFSIREVQLLAMVERAFGFGRSFPLLRRADDILLRRIPYLRRFCRYGILFFEK